MGGVPCPILSCDIWGEDPWERLEKIKASVGNTSKLTALSRGRNLFGYNPYPDKIIKGFCRNSIESGLDIMRIFDALNDVENIKSTVKYVKRFGGMADCAVCYTIDPYHSAVERIVAALHGHPLHKPVFTNEYFLDKALQMEALGADMITIKDMSGLIPPGRSAEIVRLFKKTSQSSGRFSYSLYARIWSGFGFGRYCQRGGCCRYQYLVFRWWNGCSGNRTGVCVL